MSLFSELMKLADPVTSRSVKDLNEWTGVNNEDIANTPTNSDAMLNKLTGRTAAEDAANAELAAQNARTAAIEDAKRNHPNYLGSGISQDQRVTRVDISGLDPNATYINGSMATGITGNALSAVPTVAHDATSQPPAGYPINTGENALAGSSTATPATGTMASGNTIQLGPITGLDVTDPNHAALATAIDPVITDWRTSQKPPVTNANDPRHAELWGALSPHVKSWQAQYASKATGDYSGNALSGTTDNALGSQAGASPQQSWLDSQDNRNAVLNRYYGGTDYGMFK